MQSRRVVTDSSPVSRASKGAERRRFRHRTFLRTRNPPASRPLTKVALGPAGSGRAAAGVGSVYYISRKAEGCDASGGWVEPPRTTLPGPPRETLPAAAEVNGCGLLFPTRRARRRRRLAEGGPTREAPDVRHERRPPPARARPATSPSEGRAARGLAAGISSPWRAQGLLRPRRAPARAAATMEVSGPEDDPFLSQLHQVQCPVCQQMMPAAHINSHLDRCLLLNPAGHAEPTAGPHRAGERAKGLSPPSAKRRRLSESSALKQPATPTAAESSEGEGEEGDDGGETESRESYDAPPTPSGARLIPDFPVARSSSPGRKGSGKRPAAAAAAAGSASPRSWDEAEAQEEEEAVGDGDGDADADGEDDPGHWDADAADAAAFGAGGGGRPHARALAAEEIRQMLEGKPLADKMRPDTLQDYIGQSRAVGQETLLRSLLETNEIPSLILWGPPGCGKVSAALAGGFRILISTGRAWI